MEAVSATDLYQNVYYNTSINVNIICIIHVLITHVVFFFQEDFFFYLGYENDGRFLCFNSVD